MLIRVSDIIYDDRTTEWDINMNSLAGYIEYSNNPDADRSIWRFGDFVQADSPKSICLEIPFTNFTDEIEKIDEYVKDFLSKKTCKKVKRLKISEII